MWQTFGLAKKKKKSANVLTMTFAFWYLFYGGHKDTYRPWRTPLLSLSSYRNCLLYLKQETGSGSSVPFCISLVFVVVHCTRVKKATTVTVFKPNCLSLSNISPVNSGSAKTTKKTLYSNKRDNKKTLHGHWSITKPKRKGRYLKDFYKSSKAIFTLYLMAFTL